MPVRILRAHRSSKDHIRPRSEVVTTPRVGDLRPRAVLGSVPAGHEPVPKTLTTYVGAANQLISFLAARGMPTDAAKVRREHVEAFIEDVVQVPSSDCLEPLPGPGPLLRVPGGAPMARVEPPHVPDEPVPVLGDDELRRPPAGCAGKGFEERRDMAIVRLFLDSGMRLAELATCASMTSTSTRTCGHRRRRRSAATSMPVRQHDRPGDRPLPPHALPSLCGCGTVAVVGKAGPHERFARVPDDRPPSRPGPGSTYIPTSWTTPSRRRGFTPVARRATSPAWPAGAAARCSSRYGAATADERAREAHRRLAPADRLWRERTSERAR
jgi:hypothetical protein